MGIQYTVDPHEEKENKRADERAAQTARIAEEHPDGEMELRTFKVKSHKGLISNSQEFRTTLSHIRRALSSSTEDVIEVPDTDNRRTYEVDRSQLEGIVSVANEAEAEHYRRSQETPEQALQRATLTARAWEDKTATYKIEGKEDKLFFAKQATFDVTVDELRRAAVRSEGILDDSVYVAETGGKNVYRVKLDKVKAALAMAEEDQEKRYIARNDTPGSGPEPDTAVADAKPSPAKDGKGAEGDFKVAAADTRPAKGHGSAHKGGHRRTRHAPDDDAPAFIAADEGDAPANLKTGFHPGAAGKTEPLGGSDFKTFLSDFIRMLDKAEAVGRAPSRARPEGQLVSNDSPTPTPPT
jgi:hypothetical protein